MAKPKPFSTEYDSVWKEALEFYLKELLHLFFPQIHDDIDWRVKPEALDKELQKVVPEAEVGKRYVDKRLKVKRKQGQAAWIYMHVEFQAQKELALPERMYQYHSLLYLRYKKPILSMAILGDDDPNWRPEKFETAIWGSRALLEFCTVKLWDYRDRIEELKQSGYPFAYFLIAHLKTLETRNRPENRLSYKTAITQEMMEQGFSRKDVHGLFKFIDALMALPADLEQNYLRRVYEYQEEKKMPFIAPYERLLMERELEVQKGIQKGLRIGEKKGAQLGSVKEAQAAVLDILRNRLGPLSVTLKDDVKRIEDLSLLRKLRKQAIKVDSIDEFEQLISPTPSKTKKTQSRNGKK